MEEFARGFPNQHTTHRDTSVYSYANVCEEGEPTSETEGRGGDGEERCAEGTMVRGDSAIASIGVGFIRARVLCVCTCIHIYTRTKRRKARARACACAGRRAHMCVHTCMRKCMHACVHACVHR